MAKPTEAKVKELWELCGLKLIKGTWYEQDGTPHYRLGYAPIDLNSLFQYAEEPLVKHFIDTTSSEEEYRQAYNDFLCKWLKDYIWNEPHDPAQALFWAISPVLKKAKK